MNNQPIPKQPSVHFKDGHPVTTSLAVAEAFGRQHKNVLQTIESLDCSEEFRRLNFKPSKYLDARGKSQPCYEVTRDGFLFVGMGFTGAAASAMKEAYITAFNAMEAQLSANLPRPGQVEALRLKRVAEALSAELLRADPSRRKILRYRNMGHSVREIGLLTGKGQETVRREITLLEACGHLEVTPLVAQQRVIGLNNLLRGAS